MPNNNSKIITYGAMMAVLFSLLILLSIIPAIGIVGIWFVPLPIILNVVKFGTKPTGLVVAVGAIISFLLLNFLGLSIALFMGIVGMAIGHAIRQNKSKIYILMTTMLTSLISGMLLVLGYVKFANINVFDIANDNVKDLLKQIQTSQQALQGPNVLTDEKIQALLTSSQLTLPVAVIMMAFIYAIITIIILSPVLKKLGVKMPKFAKFKDLRFPKIVLFIYLIVLIFKYMGQYEEGTYMYMVILNLSLIIMILFIIQGISFIHFVIDLYKLPKALAWMGTFIAILPALNSYVLLLGIIDLGFDLRMLLSQKIKK